MTNPNESPNGKNLKLILGGRWGVGKTSIRRKILTRSHGQERFKRNYLPTVGSDFSYKDIEIDGDTIRILLWDLAGEKRFRKFRSLYFQGAKGAILVFDLTDLSSFDELDEWVEDLKSETVSDGVPIVILGNKSDLILDKSEKCVSRDTVLSKISEYEANLDNRFSIDYFEVSALTGKNIDKAFENILLKVINWYEENKVIQ